MRKKQCVYLSQCTSAVRERWLPLLRIVSLFPPPAAPLPLRLTCCCKASVNRRNGFGARGCSQIILHFAPFLPRVVG